MSGSSKRKARRERARAAMTAEQPRPIDKPALAKFVGALAEIVREVMPSEPDTGTQPDETRPPPESPEEAGAVIELPRSFVPLLVERVNRAHQQGSGSGKTYEEDNWDKLSPKFRDAHNRLLQVRGLPTIPPPKVDNYKPPPPNTRRVMAMDAEALAAARTFLRLPEGVPMIPGEEGLTIDGVRRKI